MMMMIMMMKITYEDAAYLTEPLRLQQQQAFPTGSIITEV